MSTEKFFWTTVIVLIMWVMFGTDTKAQDDCLIITAENFGRCHMEVVKDE